MVFHIFFHITLFFLNCWANYKLQTNYDNYKLKGRWLLVQPTKTNKTFVSSSLLHFLPSYFLTLAHFFDQMTSLFISWEFPFISEKVRKQFQVLTEVVKALYFLGQFYHRFLCLNNHLQPGRKISFLKNLTYQSKTINLNGATLKKN